MKYYEVRDSTAIHKMPTDKEVVWDMGLERRLPTLAEVLRAAAEVFSGTPPDQLVLDAEGYDAEVILLQKKRKK